VTETYEQTFILRCINYFIKILVFASKFPGWRFPRVFPNKVLYSFILSPTLVSFSAYLGLSQLFTNGYIILLLNISKAAPLHAMKVPGGRRDNTYPFTTSALDGGEWSASRPVRALTPGKRPPVPIGQEAGWGSEPVWTQITFK
jgi:hypothetical protein